MTSWHSYPSIYNLGHKSIQDLLKGPVQVEEKVDGSQFSFGLFQEDDAPVLKMKSKNRPIYAAAHDKMFEAAAREVDALKCQLRLGWTYRAEYLSKPKHNVLAYARIPARHLIVFDINPSEEAYLPYEEKKSECNRLGLECVPLLSQGIISTISEFRQFLDSMSCLGGHKIEGVVVKPIGYNIYGKDKKALMGKFVSEEFKEIHRASWKHENAGTKDILIEIANKYTAAARWNKAIIHLRERGEIADDVRDIGKLIKEVPEDIRQEFESEIKDQLFDYAWPHIKRMVTRGLPEFYKQKLLEKQFEV